MGKGQVARGKERMMTYEEAISELVVIKSVYSHMRGEYKPCAEALQMAIDLLKQADTPQTEDDLLLELMDAVERGEMSDASANQAYVEYISKRVEESDTPQTGTEIARAIVHKMIDDAVIAEDAYPDLRQKMHDAVDEYKPQTVERAKAEAVAMLLKSKDESRTDCPWK